MTVFLQAVRYFTNIFFKFTTQKVQINSKQGNLIIIWQTGIFTQNPGKKNPRRKGGE